MPTITTYPEGVEHATVTPEWGGDELPTRLYPATTLHGDTLPLTTATDHGDRSVQAVVYNLRNRQGDDRMTHDQIAYRLGLRHWRDSYNAARNAGRRADGDNGRNIAGDLTWRAWNRPRNMRLHPGAAPARDGSRSDTSLTDRRFGIEIEFNSTAYGADTRRDIVDALVAQHVNVVHESYNHTTRRHWKMTTDATVSGGELVSPIMAGDTASLDEVRDAIRAVKANGGTTGRSVGMHVHHDVTDFTEAWQRQALVRTLSRVEHAMSRYVIAERANGTTSCGAELNHGDEWARIARSVVNIIPGSAPNAYHDSHSTVTRYRFFNVEGVMAKYGTVEFRGLGGTLHAGKVRVWVRMGQAIVKHAKLGHEMPEGGTMTPQELADELLDKGLIGPRTATKFVAECTRRHP